MQFREICLLQCSTIINTFWVDPHSELLKKVPVKPKNRRSQSAANLSTQTRYKVCSNGFAYLTTPTTSIFKQLVLASMMWFVSISLFQVAQTSYYKIVSTSQLVKTSLLSTSLLQFCKRTSLLQLVHNLLQSCQANM